MGEDQYFRKWTIRNFQKNSKGEWLSWERVKPEYDECSELLAIFTSIGKHN
jgi:hypothetical protein